MGIFELIGGLAELTGSWRLYLCIAGGLLLVYALTSFITYEPFEVVLSACIFIASFVFGWRWESAARR